MAAQTYDVLFPLLVSGTSYVPAASGSPNQITLDDQDPVTLQWISVGQIVLASAPNAASLVSADQADITSQDKGPGQANTPVGEGD